MLIYITQGPEWLEYNNVTEPHNMDDTEPMGTYGEIQPYEIQ